MGWVLEYFVTGISRYPKFCTNSVFMVRILILLVFSNFRLTSYTSVKCPKCEHCFKSNDSRILPDYVRYLSACNRLELNFTNKTELKRWLVVSNLDTDANGLPVIRANSPPKTLKATESQLIVENKSELF